MEPAEQKIECVAIFPPNPTSKRGKRVTWHLNENLQTLIYSAEKNVVLRNLSNGLESKIINNQISEHVTSTAIAPDGSIAYGTEKGVFRLISWNEVKQEFEVKVENSLIGAAINEIQFTQDGSQIVLVGDGGTRAVSFNLSGKVIGELKKGHNARLNSCAVNKGKTDITVLAGDDKQVHFFRGPTMKYEKSIQGGFTGFINKVALLADDKACVAVSADKSIKIFNTENLECITKIDAAHALTIYDCSVTDSGTIFTSSSDKTIKSHQFDAAAGSLTLTGEYTLNETDAEAYKENFMK